VEGIPFVYRKTGDQQGVPLVFLHHFTAVLDDWDPRVVDGLAAGRPAGPSSPSTTAASAVQAA